MQPASTHHNLMFVQNRDEKKEDVCVDKIATRIKKMCYDLTSGYVDPVPPRRLLTLSAKSISRCAVLCVGCDCPKGGTEVPRRHDTRDR